MNDLRRKPGSHSHDGVNDKPDRGRAEKQDRTVGKRESAMAGINAEAEQREQRIADLNNSVTIEITSVF